MCAHQRVGQCAGESKTRITAGQFGRARNRWAAKREKLKVSFRHLRAAELKSQTGRTIPAAANVRHLVLNLNCCKRLKKRSSLIWAVDDVTDALPLLLNLVWDGEGQNDVDADYPERICAGDANI